MVRPGLDSAVSLNVVNVDSIRRIVTTGITFIHRKTAAPKITSEQIESSTESEEEDDRVLDGKVVSLILGKVVLLSRP